ncbi:hypothetical protein F2Q69_00025023 [Brassica cretica]|uniref:Uncharacterized protein n=1 Tax=Brassica cretica TaxID=69181 RepID=A0A8S9Q9S6_BRACR|nr:hypothetical protein F2Q69_00025023 [Brassica cretica]
MYFVRMVAFMPKMNSFEHVLFHFILRYQIPESSCGVREIQEAVYFAVLDRCMRGRSTGYDEEGWTLN